MFRWSNSHVNQCLVCTFCDLLKVKQTTKLIGRSASSKNHYETLGVPRTATQQEIKDAYYELSKMYHPDKKKGCEYSAKKFRDITAAYEILKNYRIRKLYDKGAINIDTSRTEREEEPIVEDDAQTKFYKQHMQRSHAPGRSHGTDFDDNMKALLTRSFQASQTLKQQQKVEEASRSEVESGNVGYVVVLMMILIVLVVISITSGSSKENNSNNSISNNTKPSV